MFSLAGLCQRERRYINSLTTRLGDRTGKGKSFSEKGGETGRLIDKIRGKERVLREQNPV